MGSYTKDNLQLALVTWNDAWTDNEAVDLESVLARHKPTVVNTLGWILYENPNGIMLVNEYYDSSYRGRTFIPRAMITTVLPLKLSKPRIAKHETPDSHPGPAE